MITVNCIQQASTGTVTDSLVKANGASQKGLIGTNSSRRDLDGSSTRHSCTFGT